MLYKTYKNDSGYSQMKQQRSLVKELIVIGSLLFIIGSMILPVPAGLMDLLLVANLCFALILLLSSVYISEPLKLSALPTILLLATLFRLALNISSTRLVLSSGDAGKVIEAFGKVVIQGNLVVGGVIFLIITLVQFIVIAKGSERVAEVAARFTLDALPGKQMSIDADVRAGLIDAASAREKRQDLQTESRFYGALDGAMKFVKGDSIAGIVITIINLLGGFTIGILVHGLSLSEALARYSLLTIGDGLISQMPALLNAIAAGIVVTRVSRGDGASLATELVGQLVQERKVKIFVALLGVALALFPGMPSLPFIALVMVLVISIAFEPRAENSEPEKPAFQPLTPPLLAIEFSEVLTDALFAEVGSSIDLGREFDRLRQKVFEASGLIITRPALELGVVIEAAEKQPIINSGHSESQPENLARIRLKLRGTEVLNIEIDISSEQICARVIDCLANNIIDRGRELVDDVMSRRLLDFYDKEAPELVAAVVPGAISVTQLTFILRALIEERVSVINFDLILQAIMEYGPKLQDERRILEEVRVALARTILAEKVSFKGLTCILINPVLDLKIARIARSSEELDYSLVEFLSSEYSRINADQYLPVLCCKASRRSVYEAFKLKAKQVVVLAHEEIPADIELNSVASITFDQSEEQEALAA